MNFQRIEDIGYRINDDFDMFRILKSQLGVEAANAGIGASQGPTLLLMLRLHLLPNSQPFMGGRYIGDRPHYLRNICGLTHI